jgi:hypothetical protein
MLSAEKIQSNWNRYVSEITNSFSKERSDILITIFREVSRKNDDDACFS